MFEHFVAGQLACLREMTLMFAPYVNSYKRFVEGSFAPTAVAWGHDNRTCSMRVVGHGEALRVENRLPGADVNPYLALSAMIAAGLHGIDAELPLEPPLEGNAYTSDAPRVPTNLYEARDLFARQRGRPRGVRRGGRRPLPEPRPDRARGSRGRRHRLGPLPRLREAVRRADAVDDAGRVVGICAAVEQARWASWDVVVTMAPQDLRDRDPGGRRDRALILPPDPAVTADPDLLLDRIDGLLLAGGSDIDPATYGAEPGPETTGFRPERDEFELALLRAGDRARHAGARDLPRHAGAQRRPRRDDRPAPPRSPRRQRPPPRGRRDVQRARGRDRIRARSPPGRRRRADRRSGPITTRASSGSASGLAISGRLGRPTTLIEAIELPDRRYALGVLWHPEEDVESKRDRIARRGGERRR